MKLRIIAAVVLVLALVASLCGAWILHGAYSDARDRHTAQSAQLQELSISIHTAGTWRICVSEESMSHMDSRSESVH